MAIDFRSTTPVPEPERVIEVLDDDACREIVSALEEPMTVREVSDAAEVPLSTTLGALLAGAAHQAFGLEQDLVLVIESSLTAVGFGVIVYSLYADW